MDVSPQILWALLGVVLIILEIFTTSFFLIFLGMAALLVAALIEWAGLHHFSLQLVVFSLSALAGILIFRRKVKASFKEGEGFHLDLHQQLRLEEDIPAKSSGRVFYQGSSWIAVNDSHEILQRGDAVVITKTEGVKLFVKKAH